MKNRERRRIGKLKEAAKRKEAASLAPAKWVTVQLLVTLIKGKGT